MDKGNNGQNNGCKRQALLRSFRPRGTSPATVGGRRSGAHTGRAGSAANSVRTAVWDAFTGTPTGEGEAPRPCHDERREVKYDRLLSGASPAIPSRPRHWPMISKRFPETVRPVHLPPVLVLSACKGAIHEGVKRLQRSSSDWCEWAQRGTVLGACTPPTFAARPFGGAPIWRRGRRVKKILDHRGIVGAVDWGSGSPAHQTRRRRSEGDR